MPKKSTKTPEAVTLHTITGIIYNTFNEPLSNAQVKFFARNIRSEQLLGESPTDTTGLYEITYTPATPLKNSTGIFIRITDASGTVLGESPVHFNVPEHYELNFKIGNTPIKNLNEFNALLTKINPVTEAHQVHIKKLKKTNEQNDISFLAGG